MKKRYFGSDHIISIYKFMEICGLEVEFKENVLLSHEAVRRKLELRKEAFPDKITIPVRIRFEAITNEDVLRGRTLLVEDDYKNIIPYRVDRFVTLPQMTEEEREQRRKQLIKEYEEEKKKGR